MNIYKEDSMSKWNSQNDNFSDLVGRRIDAVLMSPDQKSMAFVCGNVVLVATCDGDCCSTTWFADIVGADALWGREVIDAVEIPMPEWVDVNDGRTRQEEDKAYGVAIRTDRGTCEVIYRNSSNGYYGGWARVEVGAMPDGWTEIRADDWHA